MGQKVEGRGGRQRPVAGLWLGLALVCGVTVSRAQGSSAFSRQVPQRQQAIRLLEGKLADQAGNARVWLALGREYTLLFHDSYEPSDHDQAKIFLEKVLYQHADHVETRGWLALLTCLKARDIQGATAKSLALSGLESLDRLIENDDKNLLIRVLRASVGMGAPRSWGRLDQALDDLLFVEYAVKRDPTAIQRFGLDLAMIYLKLGKIYLARSERDRARACLEQATRGPDRFHAKKASRLLARHFPDR